MFSERDPKIKVITLRITRRLLYCSVQENESAATKKVAYADCSLCTGQSCVDRVPEKCRTELQPHYCYVDHNYRLCCRTCEALKRDTPGTSPSHLLLSFWRSDIYELIDLRNYYIAARQLYAVWSRCCFQIASVRSSVCLSVCLSMQNWRQEA